MQTSETQTIDPLLSAHRQEPRLIECEDPATGGSLGLVPVDGPEGVRRAVEAARAAQPAWARASFAQRRRVLSRILHHVLTHTDELVEIICRDAGKTRENAVMGEIWPVVEKLRWTMARGEEALRPESMPSGIFPHKRASIHYAPRGVVGIVAPWNYPLQNVLGPTLPALFAGNAVVLKVSEAVAFSSARFQRIFDEALEAEGFSRNLVRLVNGFVPTGAALVGAGVDLLIFTGSMENGKKIIAESAETLTPVILELGGKDPLIVCDDAALPQAVHAALVGVFIAAGQNCMAAERVLVFDAVYDDFVDEIVELAAELRQGAPLGDAAVDVGACVTETQVALVERLVDDAVARGARALVGGKRREGEGHFFEPTVLVDVTPDMPIMQEELFGPVMCIARVADEAEALEVANGTRFGLGSTVMTKSASRARRFVSALRAGSTSINDFGLPYMNMALPFGGVGGSGFGRLNGREGLRACTTPKAVLEDRLPLHLPSKIFPVAPLDYELFRAVLRTLYGHGVTSRVKGGVELLSTLRAKLTSRWMSGRM